MSVTTPHKIKIVKKKVLNSADDDVNFYGPGRHPSIYRRFILPRDREIFDLDTTHQLRIHQLGMNGQNR